MLDGVIGDDVTGDQPPVSRRAPAGEFYEIPEVGQDGKVVGAVNLEVGTNSSCRRDRFDGSGLSDGRRRPCE